MTLYTAELRAEYDRLRRLWEFWNEDAADGLEVR